MPHAARIVPTVGWGLFCAASWTWCIGMFLPVIMLRDDGWLGFAAFAVPNVLGCAAFGYIRSRRACDLALRHNAPAIRFFSIITVAYQLFFVGFVLAAFFTDSAIAPVAIGLIVLLVASFLGGHRRGATSTACLGVDRGRFPWPSLMAIGALTWIASMVLFAVVGIGGWSDFGISGRMPSGEIAWLVPILALGFLLCPYLDGTFHVARINAPSRHAFAIFGVTFAAMLLLSAAYASLLLRHGLVWPVLAHMLIQLVFTSAVHIRVTHDLRSPRSHASGLAWILWIVAPLLGSAVVQARANGMLDLMATTIGGEAWYLRWLALYGLVFPAMVLLLRRRAASDPTVRSAPMIAAVAIGLVLCELGFIHGYRPLVTVAVVMVLLIGLWPGQTRRSLG